MKKRAYSIARFFGLFALSRRLMRRRLLILCYHGFEVADESDFMAGVFMRPETFRRRLSLLARGGYPVLMLDDAVERLQRGTLPDNAVCITLDDGFVSSGKIGAPALAAAGFPSTLYATTYYVDNRVPIFNLVVRYMLWKTRKSHIQLTGDSWGISGTFALTKPDVINSLSDAIIAYGDTQSVGGRERICRRLGELLEVDYQSIVDDRRFSLMNSAELKRMRHFGVDVQLHTHRHRISSTDKAAVKDEVIKNADALRRMLGKECAHFCYPSGRWHLNHLDWLQELGVVSATTCERGMNHSRIHPLALNRYLDSENISEVEFQAELAGFAELLRIITGRQQKRDRSRTLPAVPAFPVRTGVVTQGTASREWTA